VFARRDDLPPEAATDRATFASYGVTSHASIPLVEDGATRRVLALTSMSEQKRWPPALIDGLRLIAEVLGQILARKHAEIESEESRALQQAMLRALPSRMAVLDRDGRVLAVNRAWLDQSVDRDQSLMARAGAGTSYLEICREAALAGEGGAREIAAALEVVLAGTTDMVETEYGVKGPGQERWYRVSVMGLGGSRGGAVLARTDVTEQVVSRERLRQFSHHLLTAQEEERRRVGRELHDDLNQRLVLLALEISQMAMALPDGRGVERVRQIGERVDAIATDVHRLAYRLHPFKLDYLGLTVAARGLCSEMAAAHDLAISFTERDVPPALPPEVALCAYRVLQEALTNVVKHSGSPRAVVSLVGDVAGICVTVRDFGMGMSPEAAGSAPGLGLASMRERLRVVNGTLVVNTTAVPGTELSATIPLPASALLS
jgi:signal transduction histidine kinase